MGDFTTEVFHFLLNNLTGNKNFREKLLTIKNIFRII